MISVIRIIFIISSLLHFGKKCAIAKASTLKIERGDIDA